MFLIILNLEELYFIEEVKKSCKTEEEKNEVEKKGLKVEILVQTI
jgi:hypothetical protein